jgi:hypothetical protein
MQRRRHFKQIQSLETRLSEEAKRLREEAKLLPPGTEREELIRKARHAETASHINEWLTSPGLRPPEWTRSSPVKNKFRRFCGGDAMKDMKAHLERLRDQAAECAILSAEAQTRKKRELFARLCSQLTAAADQIESIIDKGPSLKQGNG